MTDAVIASDLGSSGCKTVAVGFPSGRVLAASRSDYRTVYAQPGWAEQEPEDWYGAVVRSVSEVVADQALKGVRISAFMPIGVTHTAVLLDGAGRPITPSILMFDSRSTEQAARLEREWDGAIWRRTLNTPTTTWTWPQLAWIQEHQPNVWDRVATVTFQKDYVRSRLVPGHVTDHIDAAGSLLFDPVEAANVWSAYGTVVEPRRDHTARYRHLLAIFRGAYQKHIDDFIELSGIAAGQ